MPKSKLLIRLGGTIDAKPYDNPRKPPEYVETLKGNQSLLRPTLDGLAHGDEVSVYQWGSWEEQRFVKDSKEFTEKDIAELAELIRGVDQRQIIITCGTDAMADIGARLNEKLKGCRKTVIFVGAMVPLSMRDSYGSDGIDSLALALEYIDKLPHYGVLLTGRDHASGRYGFFEPDHVSKHWDSSKSDLIFTLEIDKPRVSRAEQHAQARKRVEKSQQALRDILGDASAAEISAHQTALSFSGAKGYCSKVFGNASVPITDAFALSLEQFLRNTGGDERLPLLPAAIKEYNSAQRDFAPQGSRGIGKF